MKLNTGTQGISNSELAEALRALLKDHSQLGIRLKEVPYDWDTGQHRLSGTFHYISFADGVPTVPQFIEYIYDCLIPYCLPRKKIASALAAYDAGKDVAKIVRLGDDAKSLFIKAKNVLENGGEPGELILYSLLEWALGAPRLVSKMYLKTNANMPVHGTDGIHLGYDEQSDLLSIYFGESKVYKTFSSAAESAFKSMAELLGNSAQLTREIEILNNLSDLDALSPAFKARLAEYIDPYSISQASLNRRVVHACLLGFEYPAYAKILSLEPKAVAAAFEARFRKRIASACRVIDRHYLKELPITANLHIFLLPFPSVEDFRRLFYEKIGVTL